MDIILTDNISNLGKVGDKVKVAAGYGRNYLIPQKKAILATKSNLADFEKIKKIHEEQALARMSQAEKNAKIINELVITLEAKAGNDGKLFGSIGAKDLAEAVNQAGVELSKTQIKLNDRLRHTGEYEITVHVHQEVKANLKVIVSPTA